MQFLQSEEIAPACHPNQKISCRAARADLRVTALNPSQSNNFQRHANHERGEPEFCTNWLILRELLLNDAALPRPLVFFAST